ncbi:adenylosuccinate synthetase [Pseudomonas koreensis]|uniref:adenylosuccinate synthetase n=1 Tax=Pseudomonas koreensis TaxID=198620 RepID=UPI003D99A87A
MKPKAIVLSGRVCAGKTTLAMLLVKNACAELIKTKELIKLVLPGTGASRRALHNAGLRLDRETQGTWIAQTLNARIVNDKDLSLVVIDAVRSADQIRSLRNSGWLVTHVHLQASEPVLTKRYEDRDNSADAADYGEVSGFSTERHSNALAKIADVVIDSDRCNQDDVYARVIARLENRPIIALPVVDVLVGGQYGSEGKGNIAHYLAAEYDVLVRVGGPNAGHKVFRVNDNPYTFRQLPSGALGNKDATLVIGAGAVISLEVLLREITELALTFEKVIIDPQAMIIDQEDIDWEEQTLKAAIGSTAQGIGRATARKILDRIPESKVRLAKNIPSLKHYIRDTVEFFANCLSGGKKIMLEGTQGTSLSLHHGFYPHVTSRATTAAACLSEAGLSPRHVRKVMMVCRTYPIRVGNSVTGNSSGFMSQQIEFSEIAKRSGIPASEFLLTEVGSVSHRPRRVAEFDWAQLRRSLLLNGPTDIALTFADYIDINNRTAFRYEQLSDKTLRFIEEIEKVSGIPVSMISTAFNERNIIDRRMW